MPSTSPRFSTAQRRARLVARHHLAGDAADPESATAGVVMLHATDPATVYLSVLARSTEATLADVAAALYERRSLLRLLGLRRTLFVVPVALAGAFHAGAALEIGARIRRRVLSELSRVPTEPAVPSDPVELAAWLTDVEAGVVSALERLGTASGAQLSAAEPRLRTALLPTTDKAYDTKRNITSQVLPMMAAEGRMIRTEPRGEWTSRTHVWQPVHRWLPQGWPELDPAQARAELVQAYLARFGPATEVDVTWWTGWNQRQTRAALGVIAPAEVELEDGSTGLVLAGDSDPTGEAVDQPVATLLPALDPTPMGWKQRGWFLPVDDRPLWDSNGNIGPTIWWQGEVVGGWAITAAGDVATRLLVDRGAESARAVEAAAAALQPRLEGARVVPSFRTALEVELRTG